MNETQKRFFEIQAILAEKHLKWGRAPGEIYNDLEWALDVIEAYQALHSWANANIPEMECRADNDCDHCVGMEILNALDTLE